MIRSIALAVVFAVSLLSMPVRTVNIIPLPACDPNCPFVK